jgi:hypothetical protein
MVMEDREQESPQPITFAGIEISVADQSRVVMALLAVVQRLEKENQALRDEIQRLKKTTIRPEIKPSRLLDLPAPNDPPGTKKKRPGSEKRKKTKDLRIDHDKIIAPEGLPPDAKLEGYRDFVVQDIELKSVNTRYRRAVYRLADGTLIIGQRPEDVNSHFGPALVEFILLQAHQNHVTQGRLLEHLQEIGVDISAGQLSNILLNGHENFHAEKDELLPTARQISGYLHCDDTSARHQGKAAVCTHIGNELFASFSTTDSKSRLNFLRLLCQPEEQYLWCEEARVCLGLSAASGKLKTKMSEQADGVWSGRQAWEEQLQLWGVTSETHCRQVSEAALFGKLLTEKWYDDLGLVSDDAPQFKLYGFVHGLCWVHGERKIDRLIPLTTRHRQAKEQAQDTFWELYKSLQGYRLKPTETDKETIGSRFDQLCQTKTGYPDLNEALSLLHAKREAFLAVLEYPHLPLHNNLSENDIREYARLRKISGGTRSDAGRRCRDTFMSLKKTCRKLGVSFQSYLRDRLRGHGEIPLLANLMRTAANESSDRVAAIGSG